jgi:hypothetical protein
LGDKNQRDEERQWEHEEILTTQKMDPLEFKVKTRSIGKVRLGVRFGRA